MKATKKYVGTFAYKGKDVNFSYWLTRTKNNDKPDTVLFLGAGQVKSIPKMVAHQAGAGVVVVDGLPHWHADPSADDIEAYSVNYVKLALLQILDQFGVKSMHIMAESQAAPSVLNVVQAFPKKIGNVVLIRPLGFSVRAFGATESQKMKTFKKRILKSFLQLPQSFLHDPKNIIVGLTLIRAMSSEKTLKALVKKYAFGISYDALEDCKQVLQIQNTKNALFSIILGQKDKMFPANEIIGSLKSYNLHALDIVIVPGATHSSLAVRGSIQTLRSAVDKARTK